MLKANEKNKNLNTTNNILKILLEKNFSRQDCLFAIGGGITGDISGFAASQFKRGLQFINIPTTLLAQVDSSIGGKTGVNTKFGKNLIKKNSNITSGRKNFAEHHFRIIETIKLIKNYFNIKSK